MGLDNGICVRRTALTETIPELKLFEDDWIAKYKTDYEVCYWRKCWNIRRQILDILEWGDDFDFVVSIEDVDRIIEVLKSLTADNWEESGSSIWEFSDMDDNLKNQIHNLEVLKRLMQEHELEVYFYDSY